MSVDETIFLYVIYISTSYCLFHRNNDGCWAYACFVILLVIRFWNWWKWIIISFKSVWIESLILCQGRIWPYLPYCLLCGGAISYQQPSHDTCWFFSLYQSINAFPCIYSFNPYKWNHTDSWISWSGLAKKMACTISQLHLLSSYFRNVLTCRGIIAKS